MKKIAYTFSFIVLSFVFVMAYYCCYYYATNNMKSGEIKTIYETMDENPALNDVSDANSAKEEIVGSDTKYILETYDMETETLTKEELPVPLEFLGMDRQSLIDRLSNYNNDSMDDNDDGIENIQLVSFSNACIVIRKSVKHKEDNTNYNYWIAEENGEVMVYKADKEELYLETGIETENLEAEDKKKLQSGFFIEDIQSLYNYLETITS